MNERKQVEGFFNNLLIEEIYLWNCFWIENVKIAKIIEMKVDRSKRVLNSSKKRADWNWESFGPDFEKSVTVFWYDYVLLV